MTYRFLGTAATLGDGRDLDRYGEKLDLDVKEAEEYIRRGVALLPDEQFAGAHSDADLAKYPSIGLQHSVPAEFIQTRARLWSMIHERRVELAAPAAQEGQE